MRPAAERFARRVAPLYKMLKHKWASGWNYDANIMMLYVPPKCKIHEEALRLIDFIQLKHFHHGEAYIASGGIVVTAFINECDEIEGEIRYETCNEICSSA